MTENEFKLVLFIGNSAHLNVYQMPCFSLFYF